MERITIVPTISRIDGDTIVEAVFDREHLETSLVVSRFNGLWNIEQELTLSTGELVKPYSPANNLIANECVLLPSQPEESGLKVDLLSDIQAFLHRYVDLSPVFEVIAAYYVLLTWVHDAFAELPYLRLRGDYGTGKTRGLLAIGSLAYRPFFASGASTLSPIFHTLDSFGGTLVLDEGDFRFSDRTNELVKLLNNGTVRGMPVLRTIVNRQREFNPHAFKVFGPKIIAMRGSFEDSGLESRFITEETGSRPLRADIPIAIPASLKAEALTLRNRLLHFRLCNLFSTKPDESALIPGAEPRLNQTALALLSLVDDESVRAEITDFLVRGNSALRFSSRDTTEAGVLSAALEAFAAAGECPVSVREIAERFNGRFAIDGDEKVSFRGVGSILRTRLHVITRKSNGIFVVPPSELSKLQAMAERLGLEQI